MVKIKKILACILLCLLIIPMVLPITAEAACPASVGSLPHNTDDDKRYANAYRIWSVAKAAGMSDEEAAGMIGNAVGESGIDPTVVESLYEENFTIGPKKRQALQDPCAYTRNEIFRKYHEDGRPIHSSKNWMCDHGHGIPEEYYSTNDSKTALGINADGYICNGHYAPGVGLWGWTGTRLGLLQNFAKSINRNWYDIDTQLIFAFKFEGSIVDSCVSFMKEYTDGTHHAEDPADAEAMVRMCTDWWTERWEGIPVQGTKRGDAAMKWYNEFKGCTGDVTYGRKILKAAGFPIKYTNGQTDIIDRSAIHDIVGATIEFPQSTGFAMDDGTYDEYARNAATSLLLGIAEYAENGAVDTSKYPGSEKKYSLYDLFGSDIRWYRYMGESTQPITLVDHIYSAVQQRKTNLLFSSLGETVFFDSTRYLSTRVYHGRPAVLTVQDCIDGKSDPRVTMVLIGRFNGMQFEAGNSYMGIAKMVLSLVTMMMGPRPIEELRDIVIMLTTSEIFTGIIRPAIYILLSLTMVFFIFSLVGKAKQYAVGQASAKMVLKRFFVGLFSLFIIFGMLAVPAGFMNTVTSVVTVTDELFNAALTAAYQEDDVIGSTDGTKTTEAALWKTVIFQPWCIGQFGDRYENLYTQYETNLKRGDSKMPQSYLTEEQIEDIPNGSYEYSSATFTGDVVVPVGNNTYIRNWAAFLYSCNSKYHIDMEYLEGRAALTEEEASKEITWPNMRTTAYNAKVAADTFRVIDAQMDISYQLYGDGSKINNYSGAHIMENAYGSQGRLMMIYSLILFCTFTPAIIMKLLNLLKLFGMAFQMIFNGIRELSKEGSGLVEIPRTLKKTFANFLLACLKLYILTVLFTTLVGTDMVRTIVYIVLAFVVYGLTYESVTGGVARAKSRFNQAKTYVNNKTNIFKK